MPENPSSSPAIRALVFGDHEYLCEAIKVGLRRRFEIEFAEPLAQEADQQVDHPIENLDLVIVTVLSTSSTLTELLACASRYGSLGQAPLLIITEEGQKLSLDAERVFYLAFPFTYDELHAKTSEILSFAPQYAHRGEGAW